MFVLDMCFINIIKKNMIIMRILYFLVKICFIMIIKFVNMLKICFFGYDWKFVIRLIGLMKVFGLF